MLEIKNLHVAREGKMILKGLNLTIRPGEVHAIMGPNGAGKSTLGYVLAGRPGYDVTDGSILFQGENLLALDVTSRAHRGLFLAMQYPMELPGVNNAHFLRAIYNEHEKIHNRPLIDAFDFMKHVREKMTLLGMDEKLLGRGVNEGFSGGEKKRNEMLQMLLLEPLLAVLDETDSGLDIDALQWVAKGVNAMKNEARSFIVITHYQRLLNYIVPDQVHVLYEGQIVKSGGKALAVMLEEKGYAWLQ